MTRCRPRTSPWAQPRPPLGIVSASPAVKRSTRCSSRSPVRQPTRPPARRLMRNGCGCSVRRAVSAAAWRRAACVLTRRPAPQWSTPCALAARRTPPQHSGRRSSPTEGPTRCAPLALPARVHSSLAIISCVPRRGRVYVRACVQELVGCVPRADTAAAQAEALAEAALAEHGDLFSSIAVRLHQHQHNPPVAPAPAGRGP